MKNTGPLSTYNRYIVKNGFKSYASGQKEPTDGLGESSLLAAFAGQEARLIREFAYWSDTATGQEPSRTDPEIQGLAVGHSISFSIQEPQEKEVSARTAEELKDNYEAIEPSERLVKIYN